jgi:hypothetical protein
MYALAEAENGVEKWRRYDMKNKYAYFASLIGKSF